MWVKVVARDEILWVSGSVSHGYVGMCYVGEGLSHGMRSGGYVGLCCTGMWVRGYVGEGCRTG
jgi:hypothetical protein